MSTPHSRMAPVLVALGLVAMLAGLEARAGGLLVSVVDKEGKPAADAVVIVVPQARGGQTVSPGVATVSQQKMQFVPAVSVVTTGSRVSFVNNDAWEHHVRGTAAGLAQFTTGAGGGFELRLDGKAEGKAARSQDVVLDKAGPVLLGCHIHGSMRGHIYVTDSPWTAKTGADGIAAFTDVPDGPSQLRVWHADQLIDLPAQTVSIGAGNAAVTVSLQVVPRRRRL